MRGVSRLIVGLISVAGSAVLIGCAVVDQYSGRAVVYNLQAEQAQGQGLLLNIVRAYLRRPMQFTTVSTITGVASASGGAQYTLPVNVPFRPTTNGASIAAFPPLPTWTLNGSMSGGPAFSVPVLDTQEFYQGILKPIPGQLYDLYIQAGYPRDLLFNLFVEKVVMRRNDSDCPANSHQQGCEFVFENYVGKDIQINLFQALGDYLLALGLTTESTPAPTVAFTHPHNINVRYVGAPGPGGTTAQVVAPPGGSASAGGDAPPKSYGLCFAPRTPDDVMCVGGKTSLSLCAEKKSAPPKSAKKTPTPKHARSAIPSFGPRHPRTCVASGNHSPEAATNSNDFHDAKQNAQLKASGSSQLTLITSAEFIAKLQAIADNDIVMKKDAPELGKELQQFAMKNVTLTFYLRSVEGMIYYLGEVARRQLHPEFDGQGPIFVKLDSAYQSYPENDACEAPSSVCAFVFVLREGIGSGSNDFLSVDYDGRRFSVPGANDLADGRLSSLVIDILKQQIALNSSAKSLPQSSVISVVGQ